MKDAAPSVYASAMAVRPRVLLASLLAAFVWLPAQAATVHGTLGVLAEVGAGCQVNNASVDNGVIDFGDLDFGKINTMTEQHIDSGGMGVGSAIGIEMECSDGTSYNIRLDQGLYYDGGASSRAMQIAGGTSLLRYGLYQDAARASAWQPGVAVAGTADSTTNTHYIYGRIPGVNTNVPSGSYSDTVRVSIEW